MLLDFCVGSTWQSNSTFVCLVKSGKIIGILHFAFVVNMPPFVVHCSGVPNRFVKPLVNSFKRIHPVLPLSNKPRNIRGGSSCFPVGISTIISGDLCDARIRFALGASIDLKKRFKTKDSFCCLSVSCNFIRLGILPSSFESERANHSSLRIASSSASIGSPISPILFMMFSSSSCSSCIFCLNLLSSVFTSAREYLRSATVVFLNLTC